MKYRMPIAALCCGMFALGSLVALAQEAKPKAATPPPKAAAPPARAMPADQKAYTDAMRITDPAKKIDALEKFIVNFPRSAGTSLAQRALLQTSIKEYSKDKETLKAKLDALIASAPDATKQQMANNVAWELLQANTLIEEAEQYANQSITLHDEVKFTADQKRMAELRKTAAPSDEEIKTRFRAALAVPQDTLGQIYLKQGRSAEAEKLLKEALAARPTAGGTATALAEIAEKKGDEKSAFDYLATAVLAGRAPAATQTKLEALYTKLHKAADAGKGLDTLLDDRYRKLYPTLHVPAFVATPERSDRVVLAEIFTGSGCPPCVAADLAFDAMLERYARKDVVILMYHLHIPAPDPMTNPSTQARGKFYEVRGVPSYVLDGELKSGGGSREMTQGFYDRVNPTVEQRLEVPADAKLALSATQDGTKIKVKAEPSQIKGDLNDVKLQIALVEGMLSYSGENGIRLHPVVVRSLGGESAGGFAVDPKKPEAVEHTFDVAAISAEIKAHLDDFEAKAPGGRKFSQKKDAIDAKNLAVAAFLQDQSTKKILQAAFVKVGPGKVAAK